MKKFILALLVTLLPAGAMSQDFIRYTTGNTFTAPILLCDGTAAVPCLAFANYPGTGLHTSAGVLRFSVDGGYRAQIDSASRLVLNSATAQISLFGDAILSRAAAATLQLGAADAAAPVAQTLQAQGVAAGTSNTQGATLTIQSGTGRGDATGGVSSLIFKTADPAVSGSGAQTMMTRLTLNTNGVFMSNAGVAPGYYQTSTLTAATMTNEAGVAGYARSSTLTSSYTWSNAQVVALGAALTGDITVATLPAKTQLLDAAVVITGQGAGTTTLTVSCGDAIAGTPFINYIVPLDAQAAVNTFYGDAVAERGTSIDVEHYYLPSYTATTLVTCHFISTGANLSSVTGSTGRVILTTRWLP